MDEYIESKYDNQQARFATDESAMSMTQPSVQQMNSDYNLNL